MNSASYETLKIDKTGGVATVLLNRPERLNAVNAVMHSELERFFHEVNYDEEINAILLTGAGRAFCAGGDITGFGGGQDPAEQQSAIQPAFARGPRRLVLNYLEVEAPIVVALNGDAIGLGATLALLGDIVFAADTARLADTHVRIGLVAGDGGAVIWPLLVGVNRAKEFLMTGEFVSASEAERLGLVNHVVPSEELLEKSRTMAARLASGPTWAVRWTKASVNKIVRERLNAVLDTSLAYESLSAATADHKEAARAFMEKRPPKFVGH
jgi:enoyl-CoA hydratase